MTKMTGKHRNVTVALILFLVAALTTGASQTLPPEAANATRIVDEVLAHGQQMRTLQLLSDEIGSRLTGTPGALAAEKEMEAEMKRLGLINVGREPFTIPVSWERGTATAMLISPRERPLTVASYTWTPGTSGAVEGALVDVGAGRPEDVQRVRSRLKGAIAFATPAGATLDDVIYNFYRTPLLATELKEAGAQALLIASDANGAMKRLRRWPPAPKSTNNGERQESGKTVSSQ